MVEMVRNKKKNSKRNDETSEKPAAINSATRVLTLAPPLAVILSSLHRLTPYYGQYVHRCVRWRGKRSQMRRTARLLVRMRACSLMLGYPDTDGKGLFDSSEGVMRPVVTRPLWCWLMNIHPGREGTARATAWAWAGASRRAGNMDGQEDTRNHTAWSHNRTCDGWID